MAFEKLVDILTKEDLDAISKSSKEFREGFVLR
jgi:hypothetical protein